MEISFEELREKEIVNLSTGKKLGQITDFIFNLDNNIVKGIFVSGEKKIFKKNEDIFIPISHILSVGDDIILVKISEQILYQKSQSKQNLRLNKTDKNATIKKYIKNNNFVRYKRISNNKYK